MGSYFAYINLRIGDIQIVDDVDRVVQLDHIRLVRNTGSVVIEVYDNTAIEVEKALLSQSTRDIEFWYGYDNGKQSKHYIATATKITPTFTGVGNMITIEGIPREAYISSSNTEGKAYSGTPSEIVQQVANDEGWIVKEIVATKSVDGTSESYEDTSQFTVRRSANQSAEEFLVKEVVPCAVTEDGKGNFLLTVEETTEGVECCFFPAGYKSSNRTFEYVIGQPSEEIISFEPQYGEFLYAAMGSNGGQVASVDSVSNEEITTNVEIIKFAQAITNVVKESLAKVTLVSKSSSSRAQQEAMAQNVAESLASASYQAVLTIKGDPSIVVGETVNIRVITPNGDMHFSSGEYFVQTAEDLVESDFTTTLTLTRFGQIGTNVSTKTNVSGGGSFTGNSVNYTQGSLIGNFKITAYCSCKKCCGKWSPEVTGKPSTTRSGTNPVQGRTIAVDPSVIPLGKKVIFDGVTYTAEDTGSAVKGNHIDKYFSSHQDAVAWGVQYKDVYAADEVVTPSVEATAPADGSIPESEFYTACQSYLGIPYVWGGTGPDGYDCSGFVWHMFKSLGYSWGRTTASGQAGYGSSVPVSGNLGVDNAKPGDLLFNYSSSQGRIVHVMCYLGNGYMVHAPHSGDVIKIARVYKKPYCIRRLF